MAAIKIIKRASIMKIAFRIWVGMVKHRILILIACVVFVAISGVVHLLYPSSTVVVGVSPGWVDSNGKLTGRYKAIETHLATYGVKLEYRYQTDEAQKLVNLEWATLNPEIDFVFHLETGASPPADVTSRFRSVGTINRNLRYFYARDGVDVANLRDLKGKKIIIWTSPEGKLETPFAKKDFVPSIYSSDWILHQLFRAVDVTPENTSIINSWPNPVSYDLEWDVLIESVAIPSVNSRSNQLRSEILNGKLKLANIRDIQALEKRTPFETYALSESSLSIPANIPPASMRFLSTYQSVAVKKDLDPSLVLILSEALQNLASPKTVLRAKNEFPNFASQGMFEPHPVAVRFYREGKPFLATYVSPGFATFLMKLALVLIPLLTILWPITNLIPKIYAFYVKHKITRWYVDLELIDKSFELAGAETRKQYLQTIEDIRQGIAEMRLPIMHTHYVQELFAARAHVELIKRKINEFA
jgi:hypothetical protein